VWKSRLGVCAAEGVVPVQSSNVRRKALIPGESPPATGFRRSRCEIEA
jgi:hypothetical protein